MLRRPAEPWLRPKAEALAGTSAGAAARPHTPSLYSGVSHVSQGGTEGNTCETEWSLGVQRTVDNTGAMEDPTPYLGISDTHRAASGDAALAQRLAELGEVVRPDPAHAPDPGPDVAPARTDVSFVTDGLLKGTGG